MIEEQEFRSLAPEDWNIEIVGLPDGGAMVQPVMSAKGRQVFEATAAAYGMTPEDFFEYLIRVRVLEQIDA